MKDFMSYFSFKRKEDEPKQTTVNTVIIQDSGHGSSGTEIQGGYYDEEYLEELTGKERAIEFDKIRRGDYQAKMCLSAVKNPIRRASKEVQPASDDTAHQDHARLCEKVFLEDIDADKFLNEALLSVDFGHSIFERSHKINTDVPLTDEDGRTILNSYIGLNQPGWRSPKTIENWNFDPETKKLVSIVQDAQGDIGGHVTISAQFLTIITIEQEGSDFEGIPLLRPCYGPYKRKNHYLKWNAIGIEKSMPIPTAEVPAGQENSSQFTALKTVLQRFTTHQQNYITYPAGWAVNLSNGTAYDPAKVETSIDNEDKRMTKAFLANFLELGMGTTGSYALSNDLSDFFLSGLDYIAKIIEKAVNEIFKELIILNFGEQDKYPTFKLSGISDKAGKELAEILGILIEKKVIIPDDNLETHIRKRIGISDKSEDGQREVQPQKTPGMEGLTLSEKIKFAIKNRKGE